MDIDFVKMHGAGNDYVYLDLIKNPLQLDFPALAEKISDRHFGVGGDGLVLIMESGSADFRMRMLNADGSEAEMCGNAIRCVGKYLHDSRYTKRNEISIETLAGTKHLEIVKKDPAGRAQMLRVDMGEPVLNGRDIPVNVDAHPVVGIEVQGHRGTAVSMGNPHFVVFVDSITDENVLADGPLLEKDPIFPNKANIEFNEVLDRSHLHMRVWERGSGETLACGTGACASAVAGVLSGLVDRSVDVRLLGGTLHIEWNEKNSVLMTGSAEEVFRGVYYFT
jgi:diaminopimelate epimerase